MGDKPHKLSIKVDLSCCHCRQKIQDYLCRLQRKECMQIVSIEYDLKKDVVLVSCHSDPEKLTKKLLCKLPKVIKGIEIIKDVDEKKKVFMNKCDERYKEIQQREENCKKECEKKCMKECEDPFKWNQKCKCPGDPFKCKCTRKYECSTQSPKRQVTIVCCARPCPCWIAWSNCYRCCSCGVESWPGRSGPGCGSGPSYGGTQQWSNYEPSRPTNFILESTEQPCSIM